MEKASTDTDDIELRAEYDLVMLGPGVRGKYYQQATAGTNLFVLIKPGVEEVLPDSDSENRPR